MPNTRANNIAESASSTVAGKRVPISSVTFRRDAMLTPKSSDVVVFR